MKTDFITPEMKEIQKLEKERDSFMNHLRIMSEENRKLREENDALNKMFELLGIKQLLKDRSS